MKHKKVKVIHQSTTNMDTGHMSLPNMNFGDFIDELYDSVTRIALKILISIRDKRFDACSACLSQTHCGNQLEHSCLSQSPNDVLEEHFDVVWQEQGLDNLVSQYEGVIMASREIFLPLVGDAEGVSGVRQLLRILIAREVLQRLQ